jgi:hypothetical protein
MVCSNGQSSCTLYGSADKVRAKTLRVNLVVCLTNTSSRLEETAYLQFPAVNLKKDGFHYGYLVFLKWNSWRFAFVWKQAF